MSQLSHLLPRRAPSRRPAAPRPRSRPRLERLEDRTTPSIITWTNRGVTSGPNDDYFNDVFGANAGLARSVVDTAINEWSSVVTNLNGAGSGNSLPVQISMAPNGWGEWAGTGSTFYPNGMPQSASITIGSGTDGHGGGWYLDPNLLSSAFTGTPNGPFAGYAQAGSPAANKGDLLECVAHEMAHALGYQASAKVLAHATNTGTRDYPTGAGYYWAFVGAGGFHTLMDSLNAGADLGGPYHAARTGDPAFPISYGGLSYWGTDDLLTPSFRDGQRRLVSRNDAWVLRDAYGYTVNDPATALGTFYAQLDSTGKLWVRGRQDVASADTITLGTHSFIIGGVTYNFIDVTETQSNPVPGTQYTGPYTATFYAPAVGSIEIDTGAGVSTVNIQQAFAAPITVNNAGPATVTVGLAGYSLGVAAPVTVSNNSGGAFGTTVTVDDSADGGARTVTLGQTTLGGSAYGTVTGLTGGTLAYQYSGTSLGVLTGTGSNTINVLATGTPTGILDNGGGTIHVGNPAAAPGLAGIQGELTLGGPNNLDTITIDDGNDALAHTALLDTVVNPGGTSSGQLTGLGAAPITWAYGSGTLVNVYFGSGTGTVNVRGTGAVTNLFNSGPATVNVGNPAVGPSLGPIRGPLDLRNSTPNAEVVNIDDGNDVLAHTALVDTVYSSDQGFRGLVEGIGAAEISWVCAGAKAVNVTFGSGTGTVNVRGTGTTTNVFNNGPATVNVGDTRLGSYYLQNIQGDLSLGSNAAGPALFDVVNVNDGNDLYARTALLETVIRANNSWFGRLTGLGAAAISWDYFYTAAVNAYFGSGTTVVNVAGTGEPTKVHTSGPATVNVTSSEDIQGALSLTTGTGADTLNVQGGGTGPQTYTVTATSLAASGAATITWGALNGLVLNLDIGTSACYVESTAAGAPVTINALVNSNISSPAVYVSPTAKRLSTLAAPLTVHGASVGNASVTVYDQASAAAATYTVTTAAVAKAGSAGVFYSGVQTVTVYAGNHANDFAYLFASASGNHTFVGLPGYAYLLGGASPSTPSAARTGWPWPAPSPARPPPPNCTAPAAGTCSWARPVTPICTTPASGTRPTASRWSSAPPGPAAPTTPTCTAPRATTCSWARRPTPTCTARASGTRPTASRS